MNSSKGLLGRLTDGLRRTLGGPDRQGTVTVVSGLPRSGTSMMMKMLEEGGIPPLTDKLREADEDNPKGYYEFERVKKLEEGDTAWLPQAQGRAVKVISALLRKLPEGYTYKVLFMRRDLDEVLASQKKMLERRGEDPEKASDEELRELFQRHLAHIDDWARRNDHVEVLYVNYNRILEEPQAQVNAILEFLGRDLDAEAMASVIDPSLYRNRARD